MDLEEYILAHTSPEPERLHRLVRESYMNMANGRMCSGHLQGRLLKMLTQMIRPRRVLELGTFTAYSCLCMAEGLEPDGRIVTLEANDEYEDFIRRTLASHPDGHKVELCLGDALALMAAMAAGSFDMIFIDADKRQYPDYYPEAMRLLRPGGFILADNTLWDGHVAEEGRHDPQTCGVRRFNDLVAADPLSEQVILPLRDGLTLIRKRNDVS